MTPFDRMNLARVLARVRGITLCLCLSFAPLLTFDFAAAQDAQQPARAALDQVLGTVTSVDHGNKSFVVKDDKTGTEFTVSTTTARRFLKVPPGEKDLRKAQPLEESDIAVGDRLLARGKKDPASPKLEAAIVIVMTANEIQQKHESELADWQKRGRHGTVATVDPATNQITITERTSGAPGTITVTTTSNTQFTRYAPDSVKFADAKPSSISEIRPGDQIRVLATDSSSGSTISAEKVISGAFRTVAVNIVSVAPDGKQLEARDVQTKQPVSISLTADTSVRRLPPMMATMLARRANGGAPGGAPGAGPEGAPGQGRAPAQGPPGDAQGPAGAPPANGEPPQSGGPGGRMGGGRMNGDMSQMLERMPKISVSDLKPGDAVIISGGSNADKSHLIAINIIAGVEPLFTTGTNQGNGRRGSVDLSNWGLDVGMPGEQ